MFITLTLDDRLPSCLPEFKPSQERAANFGKSVLTIHNLEHQGICSFEHLFGPGFPKVFGESMVLKATVR